MANASKRHIQKNYSYTRITLSTSVGNWQASLHIHTRVPMQCWTAPICQSQWPPVPAEASRMAPPICRRSVLLPRSPVHTERLCDRMKTCPKRKCSSATCASTLLDSTVTHIIRHVVQHNYLPIYSHSQALTPSTGRMIPPCKVTTFQALWNSKMLCKLPNISGFPDKWPLARPLHSISDISQLFTNTSPTQHYIQHTDNKGSMLITISQCISWGKEQPTCALSVTFHFVLYLRPLAPSTHLL